MKIKTSHTAQLIMAFALILWLWGSAAPAEQILAQGMITPPYAKRVILLTAGLFICYTILRRLLTSISIESDRIHSVLFGRKQCEISMDKPVYYVLMSAKNAQAPKWIVISNTPFVYSTKASALYNPFYLGASPKQRIILPYTDHIKQLLPTAQWLSMDTYDWKQYTALYDALPYLYRRFSEKFSCPRKMIALLSVFALEVALFLLLLFRLSPDRIDIAIACLAVFSLSLLVINIIQNGKPYQYLWLFISRNVVHTTMLEFSASHYRPAKEEKLAEISLKAPVYYVKIRYSSPNLHAANYILLSNKELSLQRAKIRHYAMEQLDFSQIVPVIYCKHTAKWLDLSQFIQVE